MDQHTIFIYLETHTYTKQLKRERGYEFKREQGKGVEGKEEGHDIISKKLKVEKLVFNTC